jgi:ADP-heptose:LPS heptosyltransferase
MMHEVERGLDLVGALGFESIESAERDLVLDVPPAARAALTERLAARDVAIERGRRERPLVVVHPGCSMPARTYPWEMFAQAIDLLVEQRGAVVALTGVDDERDLVARIIERLRPANRAAVIPLAGALPFPEFCALIAEADLTLTNNTGPMHVSAALKTPVVALFALTNPPEQWGPWRVSHRQLYHDVPCRICYSRVCPYGHECLRLVTPQQVVDAAAELLQEQPALSYELKAVSYS